MVIGITGAYGSGKSTVLEIFRRRGARVLSADEIVGELLEGEAAGRAIREAFGGGVFDRAGRVDRPKLADRVFSSPAERRRLEAILHPPVMERIRRAAGALGEGEILAVEVPLLFEAGRADLFDRVVCVRASPGAIRRRLAGRGVGEGEVSRRLAAQMPMEEKEKRSDFVVDNETSPAEVERQVDDFLAILSRIER